MGKKGLAITAFFLLCILLAFIARYRIAPDIQEEDIYYSFVEGERITRFENPYSRIHESDMLSNRKYATYFPLFYELSALTIWAGLSDFPGWLEFWRVIFLFANLCVGSLIFYTFYKNQWYLLGLLATGLWFFNGWTLFVVFVVHLDILAVFPLVLALVLYPRNKRLSLISFSFSLAIKQIAIFIVPLFLIWEFRDAGKKGLARTIESIALIMSVPLFSAIPFLLVDPKGFLKSTLFSVTRLPHQGLKAIDISSYLQLDPLVARIPLLIVLLVILFCVWKYRTPKYLSAFLVLIAFTEFNPVSFPQYLVWPMALLPFVIFELYHAYFQGQEQENHLLDKRGQKT